MIVAVGILLIFQMMPRSVPLENISEITNSTVPTIKAKTPVDENKARLLAESSPYVQSILSGSGFHYDGVFYISGYGSNGTFQLLTVNVTYQADNHTIGPLVVTEDPQLTKILNITIQQGVHYTGSGK